MTPNFALSLSFDGIRLLHRVPGGWHLVGEVLLDSSNLAQELAVLRRTAVSLDPSGVRTKIVIPNDQIKYLAIDGTRATETEIRRTLEGATPYRIDELVIDHSRGGGRTYVAAVPRETLEEAEAFAVENKFSPVSFVAAPEPFTYQGEVFFGRTRASFGLLPPGEAPSRDDAPVRILGAQHMPKPVTGQESDAPVLKIETAMPEAARTPAQDPTPEDPVSDLPVESHAPAEAGQRPAAEPEGADLPAPAPEPVQPDATAETVNVLPADPDQPQIAARDVIPEPADEAAPEPDPAPDESEPEKAAPVRIGATEPAETLAANDQTSDAATADAPVQTDAAAAPEVAEDPAAAATSETGQSSAEPEAAPIFASRSKVLRADDDSAPAAVRAAPTPSPRASAEEPAFASRHRGVTPAPVRNAPPSLAVPRAEEAPKLSGEGPKADRSVPEVKARFGATPVEPGAAPRVVHNPVAGPGPAASALGGTLQPDHIVAADDAPAPEPAAIAPQPTPVQPTERPARGGLFRSQRKPGKRRAGPAAKSAGEEADRLTVFGARRGPSSAVGGKPRYLLLVLMAILLLFMAVVAVFAARTEGGLAALLGITDPSTSVAAATTDIAGTDTTRAASSEPVAELAAAPALEAPAIDAEPLAAAAPTDAGPRDQGAAVDALTAAVIAAAAQSAAQSAAQATDDPATASQPAELSAVSEAAAPTTGLAGPAADTAPAAAAEVLSPAEAQRRYEATGVWQRAPRLPLVPRTEVRPEVVLASLDVASKALRAPSGLPDAGQTAPDPVLTAQPLPPAPGVVFARDTRGFILATPEGTALPNGLVVYAGAPAITPPVRPGSAQAAEPSVDLTTEDPAAPLDPTSPEIAAELAASDAGAAALAALAGGPRPRLRPEALAPAEPDLSEFAADPELAGARPQLRPEGLAPPEAVAEAPPAAAEPEAPGAAAAAAAAAASTVDVAAIADAIAASAPPDPAAGATALAPPASTRPDGRPRNFDQVVQAARRTPAPEPTVAAAAAAPAPQTARNATVAPSGPVPGGVARAATEQNVINLRDLTLLGVSGGQGNRRAIVRQPNGRILTVSVGDNIDGGRVTAIGDHELIYQKRGRSYTLEVGG